MTDQHVVASAFRGPDFEQRELQRESDRRQREYARHAPERAAHAPPALPEDALPPSARARLDAWRLDRDEAIGHVHGLSSKVSDLREAIARTEGECARLTSPDTLFFHTGPGGGFAETHPIVLAERAKLAKLRTDFAAMGGKLSSSRERWETLENLVKNVEQYLKRASGKRFVEKVVSLPKKISPHEAPAAIEDRRRRGREIQSEILKASVAPIPSLEAKRLALTEVQNLAASGQPDVFQLLETRGGRIVWNGSRRETFTFDDVLPLLIWAVGPNQLYDRIAAQIDADADDEFALTDEARGKLIATLQADLLATEREESALIDFAIGSAIVVHHRAEIDPRAALGVAVSSPKCNSAA
jgi:hypothetical protein